MFLLPLLQPKFKHVTFVILKNILALVKNLKNGWKENAAASENNVYFACLNPQNGKVWHDCHP